MDQKHIVALELSGTQVKGVVASVGAHAPGIPAIPTIEAIASEDNADCVQYGRVQNLINATKYTTAVIKSLQNEPALADFTIKSAYAGLAGRSLASEQVSAAIDLPTEMEITQDILRNLFMEAAKMASPNKKVLKVLPRKYMVDNQTMPNPVGALGRRLRGDFTLVTCNPINQRNLDLVLSERVGLKVENYIVTPLALADMVLGEEEKQLGCALVDIGAQTTTISIYKDRALQYLAVLPIGSHNITRDIALGLNITAEKAEASKCSVGNAIPATIKGQDEISKINSYVGARAYELAVNIVANIGYAGYDTNALTGGFILTGRGARLNNFDLLLTNQTKMRVRFATLPGSINYAFDTDHVHPEDYLSLIAIVMRVCKSHDFADCVKHNSPEPEQAPEQEAPDIPANMPAQTYPSQTQSPVANQPQVQQPQYQPQTETDDSDESWSHDDPAPNPDSNVDQEIQEPPRKPSKRSMIDKIKERWNRIVNSDGLEGDAQI